jgi:Oxidoreductase family, NAD-binding Rossmann fold
VADAIGDISPELGGLAARRFGYERSETSWEAIADTEIHVVSVVVANSLHREMVEGLVAAGKHVLCGKPPAPRSTRACTTWRSSPRWPSRQLTVVLRSRSRPNTHWPWPRED